MKYKFVNFTSKTPIKKMSPIVLEKPERTRLNVKEDIVDRVKRIDSHAIWSIMLFFSSRKGKEEGINVISGIGYYYALFHCIFSLICLDFEIDEKQLSRVSHNELTNLLKKQVNQGIATNDLLHFLDDARFVREFVNYLSGETGHEKFLRLRSPTILETESFGKIRFLDFIEKLDSYCDTMIKEYANLLANIERHFSLSIFPILHREYDFDYYGEDFLENFFEHDCEIIDLVEKYLSDLT